MVLRLEGFVEKIGLSPEWKSEGVMDDESGDDVRDELTSKWGGESRHDWPGWRNESGSWFQRWGDAYLNERSVIFNEEMVSRREKATTDEEWVLQGGWTWKTWRRGGPSYGGDNAWYSIGILVWNNKKYWHTGNSFLASDEKIVLLKECTSASQLLSPITWRFSYSTRLWWLQGAATWWI